MADKLSNLTQTNSLSNEDLIYVVQPSAVAGQRSKGINKADFENTLSLNTNTNSRIVSGAVVWVSGLTYETVDLIYEINGVQFNITNGTQVTLSTANPTNPRIDVIYGDDSGTIAIETGTPSATPSKPLIQEGYQIELTFATVSATATEPDGVGIDTLYLEDVGQPTEWDATDNTGGLRIDTSNTTDPITDTKSIRTIDTLNTGDSFTLTNSTPVNTAELSYLRLSLEILTEWNKKEYIQVDLKSSSTVVASAWINRSVIDVNDLTVQTVTLLNADFGTITGASFDNIEFKCRSFNQIQYQIDDISILTSAVVTNPTNITGLDVSLDTTNFDTNLDNTITDVQKLADAVDELTTGSTTTSKTGTSIVFTENALYNEATYLTSGNLTLDLTGGVKDTFCLVYCDRYTPTISGEDYLLGSGNIDSATLNLLSFYYDGTQIVLNIVNVIVLISPSLTLTAGDEEIQVDWSTISNASNYIIERADDSGFTTNLTEVYNGALLTITDTGLTNGQIYYYRGTAEGIGFKESDYSTTESATPTVPSTDFTTNLVAGWQFESDLTDYTGNNDASAVGFTPTYTTGKVGNMIEMVGGSGDYLNAALGGGTSPYRDWDMIDGVSDLPFTIAFWVLHDSLGSAKQYLHYGETSVLRAWFLQKNASDELVVILRDNTGSNDIRHTVASGFSTATWYHLCMTYDGSETKEGLKWYKNGSEITGTRVENGTYVGMTDVSTSLIIGANAEFKTLNNLDGDLDEIKIWKNRELSSAEVTELYNLENAGTSVLP